MSYILNYFNFNESKSISNSCEKVLNDIWKLINDDIKNIKSGSCKLNILEPDFKVDGLMVKYNVNIGKNNYCDATAYFPKSSINLDIDVVDMDDEFLYYIESVLFHELLHLYQHYNLLLNNKFRPESFSIGSILPQLKKIVKTEYGNYILDILYFSLSHELSAQLHQYYFYKKKNKDYKKIENIKQLLSSFSIKKLNDDELKELIKIKNHILNSIDFYSTNKKYKKDISKSLWNESNIDIFLNKLSDIVKNKVKWIVKKMKIIDSKILKDDEIRYDETISLPTNWDDHENVEKYEIYSFIKENLNDCPIINNI